MPNLEDALSDPTGYPVIYVLRQTMSIGWATALMSAIIVILYFSNVSYLAAVSRDLFAFARDFGVPFAPWTAKAGLRPVQMCPKTRSNHCIRSIRNATYQ